MVNSCVRLRAVWMSRPHCTGNAGVRIVVPSTRATDQITMTLDGFDGWMQGRSLDRGKLPIPQMHGPSASQCWNARTRRCVRRGRRRCHRLTLGCPSPHAIGLVTVADLRSAARRSAARAGGSPRSTRACALTSGRPRRSRGVPRRSMGGSGGVKLRSGAQARCAATRRRRRRDARPRRCPPIARGSPAIAFSAARRAPMSRLPRPGNGLATTALVEPRAIRARLRSDRDESAPAPALAGILGIAALGL